MALVVAPRRYADVDEILARAIERGEPAFVLVLDSLEDPQNVGTLLRSAEAAGSHGVIFPTHHQAPLTPSAIKASAGAVEHLLLAPVDDLPGALADLHVRGLRIVGADADAPLAVRDADLRGPLALVVGSEGQGLGPAVRRRCDLLVRIPMRGAVGSLNASVAGSILLYEATTQRGGTSADPAAQPSEPDGPTTGEGAAAAHDLDPIEPVMAEGLAVPDDSTSEPAAPGDAGLTPAPVSKRPRRRAATAEPATAKPAEAPVPSVPRRRATGSAKKPGPAAQALTDPPLTSPVEPSEGLLPHEPRARAPRPPRTRRG